jgi:hypothetical protein
MGGIVARKYLTERSTDLIEKGIEAGVFLVASPSLGSAYATWLAPLARFLGHTQAEALRFEQTNIWLTGLDKEFQNLREAGRLKILGKELVEDKFIALRGLWRRQVVEPFSGARYFGESFKVPNSDHFSIAKPESADAIQHRLLCQFIRDAISGEASPPPRRADAGASLAPPVPGIFLGRSQTLLELKRWLADGSRRVIGLRGWPGIGKTALLAALAHEPDVTAGHRHVLWTSLGEKPSLMSALCEWGQVLGSNELLSAPTLREAMAKLAGLLSDEHALLVVDDIWEAEHGEPFTQVRGDACTLLFSTRFPIVADALALPEAVYQVPALSQIDALELMRMLTPSVVSRFPSETGQLVADLECLPLALHVAGRLLNREAARGWDPAVLLRELRDGAKLLSAKAPADRIDLEKQTIPTVAVLLRKSVDRLDAHTRECFAYLGPFAPKPATFDMAALRRVWQLAEPKPVVDELVDRGLLEPVGGGRFQMHALLVTLARSMLSE